MKKHDRTHFYKYFDIKGALKTIGEKSLRLSSPNTFNDPFDFQYPLTPALSSSEFQKVLLQDLAENLAAGRLPKLIEDKYAAQGMTVKVKSPESTDVEMILKSLSTPDPALDEELISRLKTIMESYNTELHQFFSDQFVLCLTEDPSNILMWSHYAAQHTGVVIRFECVEALDNIFLIAEPVQYQPAPPTYGTSFEWINLLKGGSGVDSGRFYNQFTLTKADCWHYEKEWRICIPDPRSYGLKHYSITLREPEISEIYFGCRATTEFCDEVLGLLKRNFPKAKALKMTKSLEKFALVPGKICP